VLRRWGYHCPIAPRERSAYDAGRCKTKGSVRGGVPGHAAAGANNSTPVGSPVPGIAPRTMRFAKGTGMDSERPNLLVPAANASLVPVVVMSAVGFVVDLLLKVTVAGLALACLFSLVATAAYFAIAAWVTPKLYSLHVGE